MVLADEADNCLWNVRTFLEFGVVVIETPEYRIMFALPNGTVDGECRYYFMDKYATVNGKRVTVLIEPLDSI